jgi:hypothetical protein
MEVTSGVSGVEHKLVAGGGGPERAINHLKVWDN